ncbi:hypothetical protein LV779_25595 [Streptomyces thinghirensis]|nr:hypothetical protein [Streptomyces thinghirensis]
MLRYLQPGNVEALLSPSADLERKRLRSLLVSVYDPALLDIRSVESVKVDHKEFQTAVHATLAVHGSWDKSIPSTEQARATVEIPATPPVHWIDMSLDTMVSGEDGTGRRRPRLRGRGPLVAADGAGTRPGEFERPYRLQYADPLPSNRQRRPATSPCGCRRSSSDRLDLGRRAAPTQRGQTGGRRREPAVRGPRRRHQARLQRVAGLVFPALTPDDPSQTTEQLVGDLLATQGFVAAFEAAP